eukprot:12282187-Ditylum_brightwellii.AAC.1
MEGNGTLLEDDRGSVWRNCNGGCKNVYQAAQKVECVITLLKRKNVVRYSNGNIGIGGSLDMHWPGRGS